MVEEEEEEEQQQQQQQRQREARLQKLHKQLKEQNPDGARGLLLRESVQRADVCGPCGVCGEETNTFAPCCGTESSPTWYCAECVKQTALVYARAPIATGAAMDGGGPVPLVDCSAIGTRCPRCRRDGVFANGARALLKAKAR